MVQILPQEPGLGELLGMGMSQGVQQQMQGQQQLQQAIQLERAKQAAKYESFLDTITKIRERQGKYSSNQSMSPPDGSLSQQLYGQPQQQQQPEFSDEERAVIANFFPGMERFQEHKEKMIEQKKTHEAEYALKTGVQKEVDYLESLRNTIPLKQNALKNIRFGLNKQATMEMLQNMMSQRPGYEFLRTAKGAALDYGSKQFFLEDLQKAGYRPNQFIEQRLSSAITGLGKRKEANEILANIMEFNTKIEDLKLKTGDELKQQFMSTLGYLPSNFGAMLDKQIQPEIKKLGQINDYKIQQVWEKNNRKKLLKLEKVTEGTPLTIEKAKIILQKAHGNQEKAKKIATDLGYTIYGPEVYKSE